VSFGNNSGGADVFAFDNFSIGSTAQVTPGTPEASTWVMMLAGFAGLGFVAYRRRGAKATFTAA
jgi:MYXO-CTERM domain-containing protein